MKKSKAIARKGGQALVKKKGAAFMAHIGQLGGLVNFLRYGSEDLAERRRAGHRVNPFPPGYFVELARRRWGNAGKR